MRFSYCKTLPLQKYLVSGSYLWLLSHYIADLEPLILAAIKYLYAKLAFMALSYGFVGASSCDYIAAIKPEAVFTLMNMCICIDVGIKLIFKIHLFNSFFI